MIKNLEKNLTPDLDRLSNNSDNKEKNLTISCINKLEPIDLIAIIIIIAGLILKLKGADGTVSLLLSSIAFYYFGKKTGVLPIKESEKKNKE